MKLYTQQRKLMGTAFELGLFLDDEERAHTLLDMGIQEIQRIERMLSEFLTDSETYKINHHHWKIPLSLSSECFDLLHRCLNISRLSQGCFDITAARLKRIYSFKKEDFILPSPETIREHLSDVGYQKIILDKNTRSIWTNSTSLYINFAAIGKGYASDMVKKIWLKEGVNSAFINASGDLNAFGKKPDRSPWKVAIVHPDKPKDILFYVALDETSVATSGDYEQYFMYKGVRYSHTINPITGLPLKGIKSVSIFSPSAELSDALSTAVYVMGLKKGMLFVEQLPQTHAIMIDEKNKVHFSSKIKYHILTQY